MLLSGILGVCAIFKKHNYEKKPPYPRRRCRICDGRSWPGRTRANRCNQLQYHHFQLECRFWLVHWERHDRHLYHSRCRPRLLASTINADEQSITTEASGKSLIEEDFTQQDFGTVSGPMFSEASSQTLQISDGSLAVADQGVRYVGTSATLPQTTDIYFALLFTDPYNLAEGAVVLNEPATGYFPSITPPSSASNEYPLDDQNIILVPEPAVLVLAGLGALSMLSLRRRNTQKSGAW